MAPNTYFVGQSRQNFIGAQQVDEHRRALAGNKTEIACTKFLLTVRGLPGVSGKA